MYHLPRLIEFEKHEAIGSASPWHAASTNTPVEARPMRYPCLRSWDGRQSDFGHPDGRLSKDWGYQDGRAVMAHVIDAIAFESWTGGERQFTVRFEVGTGLPSRGLRQFIVWTPRGTVTLEPLDLSYAGTFGMCSVFEESPSPREPERRASS
jgi:hypothetical protein